MLQYLPALNEAGFEVQVQEMFDNQTLSARYQRGSYGWATVLRAYGERVKQLWDRKQFNLIWIEKEALPWLPSSLDRWLLSGVPYVLDFDDGVFPHYDQHRLAPVRWLLGKRIDRLMADAALVICGNDYLANRARQAGALWVEQLPTVIDLDRYQVSERPSNNQPRIVWIGSPSTVKYLKLLAEPLQTLAKSIPFTLRVIGGQFELGGVNVECIPWWEDTEVRDIAECDIGIMPLANTQWELGKCGYKLIQYMSCGLPVVASPVGVNTTIVKHGHSGFLAKNPPDWVESLSRLLSDPTLGRTMGQAGRMTVEQSYCLQVTAPSLVKWLHEVALQNGSSR